MSTGTTETQPTSQTTSQENVPTPVDPEREQQAIDIVFDDTREPNEFLDALRDRYAEYGSFTVRQVEAVLGNHNPSSHVGELGDAVTLKGEVVYVSEGVPVTSNFGRGEQFRFFLIVNTENDEVVTFNQYRNFNKASVEKGQSVKVKGEVREHQEWRGQARTALSKVKVEKR